MANEAVLVQEKTLPLSYICSTSAAIEKGAILKAATPMTASLANGAVDKIAGIAAQEVLSTNSGFVAVYRDGLFRVKISGSVSVGDPVVTHGNANVVKVASVNDENILGIMLEDGTEGQTKLMELRPTSMQLA